MKKTVVFLFAVLLAVSCAPSPDAYESIQNIIDVSGEPIQKEIEEAPFTGKAGGYDLIFTPKAFYDISAEVKSVKKYSSGWNSEISPVDFALAWGRLTEEGADDFVKYSQRNRWYHYRYKKNGPYSKDYIINHSANTHIIPASNNLRRAVLTVKKGDKVRLKGFLVFIDGENEEGREVWWRSSLKRSDSGDNSCEVLYVNEMQLKNKIYK